MGMQPCGKSLDAAGLGPAPPATRQQRGPGLSCGAHQLPRTSAAAHSSCGAQCSSCVSIAPLHLWRLPNAAMVVSSTPLDTGAIAAAHNAAHTRLAVFDLAGRLTIWQREGASKSWALGSSLAADGLRITSLCWAPVEFGGVIAGGAADGSVAVWQEAAGEGAWRLAAVLKEGTLAVQGVAFAPPELGPLLAAAYADGFVR